MTDSFSNIEESFKNAFEHWEAPHSPSEMNAGWNQVSAHLPQVPGAHAASAGQAAGHVAGSVGKIIGFSGLGAAVVASAVVLYNIYVKPAKSVTDINSNIPVKTEQNRPESKTDVNQNQHSININSGSDKRIEKGNTRSNNEHASSNNAGAAVNYVTAPQNMPPAVAAATQPSQNNAADFTRSGIPIKQQPSKNTAQGMKLYLSDTVVCVGVPIVSGSNVSNPNIVIEWGDGKWNYFSGQNAHAYAHAGTYRAHLTIDSLRADRFVTVLETPKAKFLAIQSDNFYVRADNRSQNAATYIWNFGDGTGDENGYMARHTYTDSGRYKIRLIALNPTGCADTSYQYITVQHILVPEISTNIITPNGDGKNDDVFVKTEGEYAMTFTIFDANQNKVFQTTDKNVHWTGKNQFTGAECKTGIYFYSIIYSFRQNGDTKPITGQITLKR